MNPKRSKSRNGGKMPMVHPNAAAIDIGATMHMAAVRADCAPEPVRSFGTFTADLHRLVDWFTECGVETVVMESTSVYWIPIFELLDARGFTVFLVNARDAKHVPGRKTDVSDAQWLQRLHSFGLLRASFRPKGQIAELRAYVRQRERLLEYAASHIQHMQKALTEMNLQLHHVVADITGATGLCIIRAILAGERDPEALACLRHYSCHSSAETIAKALTGSYRAEHLFALEQAHCPLRRLPREGICLRRPDRSRVEGTEHPSRPWTGAAGLAASESNRSGECSSFRRPRGAVRVARKGHHHDRRPRSLPLAEADR
ncbi:hypothetical protein ACVWXO_011104 [Bradyrhizobium sp. LM2.7]